MSQSGGKELRAVTPDYAALRRVLQGALDQATERGKGHERHGAQGVPFEEQDGMKIRELVGDGFTLGQALKKAMEASRMGKAEAARHELRGAINYIAMEILALERLYGLSR